MPVNAEIRSINGISISRMDSQSFKARVHGATGVSSSWSAAQAQLQLRPMKLSVRVSEGRAFFRLTTLLSVFRNRVMQLSGALQAKAPREDHSDKAGEGRKGASQNDCSHVASSSTLPPWPV